jgi:hypothetical protein
MPDRALIDRVEEHAARLRVLDAFTGVSFTP